MIGKDLASSLATRLAAVPERAVAALPNLPANPWRQRRSSLPAGLAVFGLGLALGVGIGLLLFAGAAAEADEEAAEGADGVARATPRPVGSPIQ